MNKINHFVISQAAKIIAANPKFTFSCNLSASALNDNELFDSLNLLLQQPGVTTSRLIIEITENVVVTQLDRTIEFIKRCKLLGIKFALDDFGVGLSSFSQLKHLDIDYLKIDGSFIRNICNNHIDNEFVCSMVNIAQALNIKTIAEFVEDESTFNLLQQIGVNYSQGYYHDKPKALF